MTWHEILAQQVAIVSNMLRVHIIGYVWEALNVMANINNIGKDLSVFWWTN
ncbi:hypothetical protein ACJX0J_035302, partial [Zea mays]